MYWIKSGKSHEIIEKWCKVHEERNSAVFGVIVCSDYSTERIHEAYSTVSVSVCVGVCTLTDVTI